MKTPGFTAESSLKLSSENYIGIAMKINTVDVRIMRWGLPNIEPIKNVACSQCKAACGIITDELQRSACYVACDSVC